jgi:hypothetical protein
MKEGMTRRLASSSDGVSCQMSWISEDGLRLLQTRYILITKNAIYLDSVLRKLVLRKTGAEKTALRKRGCCASGEQACNDSGKMAR